jgi:hypothetical protein
MILRFLFQSGFLLMVVTGLGVGFLLGWIWALVALAGMWLSGHMVAWFRRHPPPPEAFTGGKKRD